MSISNWKGYQTDIFVGRKELLNDIELLLQVPSLHSHIVFITGDGGIGKTQLLKEILKAAHNIEGSFIGRDVISFYDVMNHTVPGLAHSIYENLTPPVEPFISYRKAHRTYEKSLLSGKGDRIASQAKRVIDSFIGDTKVIADKHKIILALDDVEYLQSGKSGAIIGIDESLPGILTWLLQLIKHWSNTCIILAGRPHARAMFQGLKDSFDENSRMLSVEPFTKEESLVYFDAAMKSAKANDNSEIAEVIANISLDDRRRYHIFTKGKPILLALTIDYLASQSFGNEVSSDMNSKPLEASMNLIDIFAAIAGIIAKKAIETLTVETLQKLASSGKIEFAKKTLLGLHEQIVIVEQASEEFVSLLEEYLAKRLPPDALNKLDPRWNEVWGRILNRRASGIAEKMIRILKTIEDLSPQAEIFMPQITAFLQEYQKVIVEEGFVAESIELHYDDLTFGELIDFELKTKEAISRLEVTKLELSEFIKSQFSFHELV